VCGQSMSCGMNEACVPPASNPEARRLSDHTCDARFYPAAGASAADFADFVANATTSATAVITKDGDTFTTRLRGKVTLNTDAQPPQAGSAVEIARLKLSADNFRAGGVFGATVKDISLVHDQRLWGSFSDPTHFQIPIGTAEFAVKFTVDPFIGSATTSRVVLTNSTPLAGVLDSAGNAFTLTGSFTGSGTGMVINFTGTLVQQPPPSNQAPVAVCANRTTCTQPGTCSSDEDVDNGSFDPDGNPLTTTNAPMGPFGKGSTAVTLTVSDGLLSDSCTATLTVNDCEAPTAVTCPPPRVLECTGNSSASTTVSATASDNCDAVTPVCLPNGTFPVTTTPVTCTATDTAGNAASCGTSVQVVDTIPPTLTAPPAITISMCDHPNLGTPTFSDSCSGVTISNDAPPIFPLGTRTVIWKATDASGNFITKPQTVTAILADHPSCCPAGTLLIQGTSSSNTLVGTSSNECILGLGGNDTIQGGGGFDFISGGAGNDNITGGSIRDYIWGGAGTDVIDAVGGDDFIDGGSEADNCSGGTGVNSIRACETTSFCNAACCSNNSCTMPAHAPLGCQPAYAQGNCGSYVQGIVVSRNGHNWQCTNGNCSNCATYSSCAPGGSGCPWGVVWTDRGTCP